MQFNHTRDVQLLRSDDPEKARGRMDAHKYLLGHAHLHSRLQGEASAIHLVPLPNSAHRMGVTTQQLGHFGDDLSVFAHCRSLPVAPSAVRSAAPTYAKHDTSVSHLFLWKYVLALNLHPPKSWKHGNPQPMNTKQMHPIMWPKWCSLYKTSPWVESQYNLWFLQSSGIQPCTDGQRYRSGMLRVASIQSLSRINDYLN